MNLAFFIIYASLLYIAIVLNFDLRMDISLMNSHINQTYVDKEKIYKTYNNGYCNPQNSNVSIEFNYEFRDKIIFFIDDCDGVSNFTIHYFINEYSFECFYNVNKCEENESCNFFFDCKHINRVSFNLSFQINSSYDLDFVGNNVSQKYYGLIPHNKTINIQTNDIDKEIEQIKK